MGIGPIIIFDKSALQSLSVDESVWFDTHYKSNLTPLFFVETLADLSKEVKKGRTAEDVVGNLAEKAPIGGPPNIHHNTLILAELYGNKIEMSRRPIIGGGRQMSSGARTGLIFEQSAEIDALQRWQKKEFLEIEHHFAQRWRESLSNIDLDKLFKEGRTIIEKYGRPKNLEETKDLARELLDKPKSRYARNAVTQLVPEKHIKLVMNRWQKARFQRLSEYAPYTGYVAMVDLFFMIAIGSDQIGRERKSNKIDLAYLYYLPFCMCFTSRDALHIRFAPVFLSEDQIFIHGDDLKEDLAKLDEYYSQLPEDVKETGVMSFAHYPPKDEKFLTTRIWDQLMSPNWRAPEERVEKLSKDKLKEIKDNIEKIRTAKEPDGNEPRKSSDDVDHLAVEFKMPVRKGKWRMLPPSVEKKVN